jgi:hypothetical protein
MESLGSKENTQNQKEAKARGQGKSQFLPNFEIYVAN